jgi:glutamate synthase (NADPH/NADH) large chain
MLDPGGEYMYRVRGEAHMWTPESIAKLQHSTRSNSHATYSDYAKLINEQSRELKTFRGLFGFRRPSARRCRSRKVESAKDIVKRFATGAMSLGSISTEAHTTLAVAMNRIGGKSNTGEGGEDEARYRVELRTGKSPVGKGDTLATCSAASVSRWTFPLMPGDSLRSKIKQVASGRFGVTAEYLSSADQIQIKMAQGAEARRRRQLPGHKVSEYIAKLRFSVPGVGLISPPPHHDIYSIEDLRSSSTISRTRIPKASISVKLVSRSAWARSPQASRRRSPTTSPSPATMAARGHRLSRRSSMRARRGSWGLPKRNRRSVLNRLRGRIAVQVDGQMKTGRDVVVGAMLGADEFGFATAPLVVAGCIMMRKCHLNTCPVGVATQDPVLRRKFTGQPEHVVNYFFFVAEEVRELMAQLGFRTFNEMIGRAGPPRHEGRASSTGRRAASISRASSTSRRCRRTSRVIARKSRTTASRVRSTTS